jgi:hypothetical protein
LKWLVAVDGQGVPLGGTVASAAPVEVRLAEEALEIIKFPARVGAAPELDPGTCLVMIGLMARADFSIGWEAKGFAY